MFDDPKSLDKRGEPAAALPARPSQAWESFNHLMELSGLSNRYIMIRHGHSEANQQGLIVGDPEIGTSQYGLSAVGVQQINDAVAKLQHLGRDVVIVSSDFLRARETAEIIRAGLGAGEVIHTEKLRERFFGALEGDKASRYLEVMERDRLDPFQKEQGVESLVDMLNRVTSAIRELEERFQGKTIVLVSHADPMQVLETGFAKISPERHMERPHIKNAEIRELELAA